MKTRRWAALGGLIGSAALILAACGGTTASTQAPLQKANEIAIALPTQTGITDFAPIASSTAYTIYNSQVEYMMWAPVVMVSGQDTIDWKDSLAKSITTNANDTKFTVTLNAWNWSNGTPITAADVAFTANLLIQACTASSPPYTYGGCGFGGLPPGSGHAFLKSVAVVPGSTNQVVFTTTAPANPVWFELNDLGQIQPMPESVWNKGSVTADLQYLKSVYSNPTSSAYKVISGPYKFVSYQNNQFWKFAPNAQYGGPKATANVVLQYETSDAAEFAALKKNVINAGYLPASLFGSASELKSQYVQTLSQGFCWYGIQLNFAKDSLNVGGSFNDLQVRSALQMGVDQAAIGKLLSGTLNGKNLSVPNYSAIPSGFPQLTQAVFGVSSIPQQYPFNPAAGKAQLIADGWALNSAGVMQKNGVQLSFPLNYDSGSTETQNAALILSQDWAQMGVKATPTPVAFDTLVAMTDSTPGESSKWAVNWTGGWCYEPNFYPTGGGMWGYYNSTDNFSNPAFNAAVTQAYAPGTPAQAQQNMYNYALATAKDLPFLWAPSGYAVDETAPYVHGTQQWFNPVQAFTLWNHLTISH